MAADMDGNDVQTEDQYRAVRETKSVFSLWQNIVRQISCKLTNNDIKQLFPPCIAAEFVYTGRG